MMGRNVHMQTATRLITISTLAFSLIACGAGGDVKDADRYLEATNGLGPGDIRVKAVPLVKVNSANFDSVSVFLYDGPTPDNHFAFTLERVNVKAGYSVNESYNRDKELTVHANWNGRHYTESTKFATHARFTITSITEQEAVIEVSARLHEPDFGSFLNLPQTTIKIQGSDLEALIEKTS